MSRVHAPLVSIGVPVYNGAGTLARSLDSLLAQTTTDIEIVISDNASIDETSVVCEQYAARHKRIRYVRQAENCGAAKNFDRVLHECRGEYFMWLAHDDWLDPEYIERCMAVLRERPDVALACGQSRFYEEGTCVFFGEVINVLSAAPSVRVVDYLRQVGGNGLFYGLMRRRDISRVTAAPSANTDWVVVAAMAFLGKLVTVDDVSIHRALGGASRSQVSIAGAHGLPRWHGTLHFITGPAQTFSDVAWGCEPFQHQSVPSRYALAACASSVVFARRLKMALGRRKGLLGNLFPALRDARWRERQSWYRPD